MKDLIDPLSNSTEIVNISTGMSKKQAKIVNKNKIQFKPDVIADIDFRAKSSPGQKRKEKQPSLKRNMKLENSRIKDNQRFGNRKTSLIKKLKGK